MSHDVFLSYSRKDQRTAEAVRAALERRGIRVWIDNESISGGSDWAGAIVGALNSSRVMVLIFSRNANASLNVRREVERALSKNITLIPFRIENVEPSDAFELFLSLPQWVDAYVGAPENHFDRLCEAVRAAMAAKKAKPPKPGPPPAVVAPLKTEFATVPSGLKKGYLGAGGAAILALMLGLYATHLPPFGGPVPPTPSPIVLDDDAKGVIDAKASDQRYICHSTTEDCSSSGAFAPLVGQMSVDAGSIRVNGLRIDVEDAPYLTTNVLMRFFDELPPSKRLLRCLKGQSGAYRCSTVKTNEDLALLLSKWAAAKR